MVIRPFGDRALLAEVDALEAVLSLHARLVATRPAGVVDLVPAARTVLVVVDPALLSVVAARAWVEAAGDSAGDSAPTASSVVEIPIAYDGPDLCDVASALGISSDELVARHLGAVWTVAFTGFAPGFGYLVSPDWPFDVPRLDSPRTRVPQGAVGLAGEFTGAYPRETPGGWRLIGRTDAPLFDPSADEPALLRPGARVSFRRVRAVAAAPPAAPAPAGGEPAFTVIDPGPFAVVEDRGRTGRLADGVAASGAADRAALRTANRLVGNEPSAAGIEIAVGGFRAVAARDLWIAVAGAWGELRVDGRPVDPYAPLRWRAGTELLVGPFRAGVRAYLAVRGGIAGDSALGSRATDTLAGLGPPPLRAGEAVATADAARHPVAVVDAFPWTPPADALEIPVAPGPRADWFSAEARAMLYGAEWVVSAQADRVGIRLDGPALRRTPAAEGAELPSEGMLPGALQVPPEGRPVVLGPDGPVTGGYPVIAAVTDAGRDLLGQARPGTRLRLRHARARA